MAMIPRPDVQELKNVRLWKDKKSGEYFFRLEYLCEDEAKIFKLIYPKVETGIPLHRAYLNQSFSMFPCENTQKLQFTSSCGDEHLVLPDEKGNYAYCETIQEKVYEMTLDQIEKKLGYKVKIISKKEEEDNPRKNQFL